MRRASAKSNASSNWPSASNRGSGAPASVRPAHLLIKRLTESLTHRQNENMQVPTLALLTEIVIDAGARGYTIADAPTGVRRIGFIKSGVASGPGLNGRLAPGGGDFALIARGDCIQIDFRAVVETVDGGLVYLTQSGRLHAPDDVKPDLIDRARWGALDPTTYYFRTAAQFETGPGPHERLNRIIALGMGRHGENQVAYRLFEVL